MDGRLRSDEQAAASGAGPAIEIDAASLAQVLREQDALPLTVDEANTLADAIETSANDEEFLASALSAVRLLVDRLDPSALDALENGP